MTPALEDDLLSLRFDGLKKVDGPSKLGDFHYVPMLFHEGRKVGKQQRLLLELYGLLLSRLQGQMPSSGIIWHGKECRTTRVRLNADLRRTERLLREVKEMVVAESPSRLILNDHCQVCEFRQRCHDQAVKEDNISLLRGMGEKEIKRYARKGIFTVTQLAHTFRPRRRGRRAPPKENHRYHALHALAVRDKRVYVFGTPQLPDAPVHVYLDIEGNPEEGFDYLVGMIVVVGDKEQRFSFWADSRDQEDRIFDQFLETVARLPGLRGVRLRWLRAGIPQENAEAGNPEGSGGQSAQGSGQPPLADLQPHLLPYLLQRPQGRGGVPGLLLDRAGLIGCPEPRVEGALGGDPFRGVEAEAHHLQPGRLSGFEESDGVSPHLLRQARIGNRARTGIWKRTSCRMG